ncbi:MAG: hypothetical protein M3R65_05335 [Gemmatimonadota bacterium]|nr:hypothetical protein [Gemmatimonadota bacterium]
MALLLFTDERDTEPVVALSVTEIFVLCAATYLHDAGMVVSDAEKAVILASVRWKEWTAGEGGGAKRWDQINDFRAHSSPSELEVRNFLADVQVRVLIAEFVRQEHHLRVSQVLSQHEVALGDFADGDPVLFRTVSDVCIAHGLSGADLEDGERFPDRRTIGRDQVNVRFVAMLLRLGDLLDMEHDRACPLLLSAAAPIPVESLGHWTQYKRITHRLIAPDRIEITAECQTQEEHRLLRDWCGWLVEELERCRAIMAGATRHSEWKPPVATILGANPTIKILPAAGAQYTPTQWIIELDADQVLQRLIRDVYSSPLSFVRELLQNACDASRVKLYNDLRGLDRDVPTVPSDVDGSYRENYPIRVSLDRKLFPNAFSGEQELYDVVTVNDVGIGMDRSTIERYLLQIGRSFYTSDEFHRSYSFAPTSRFGIGFLSVFGVSDCIEVETRASIAPTANAIKMKLTGPRSYMLTSPGTRREAGTAVTVRLRERLAPGALTKAVRDWCRAVEFPIIVDENDSVTEVTAEDPLSFCKTWMVPYANGDSVKVEFHHVRAPGIRGAIFITSYTHDDIVSWCAMSTIRRLLAASPFSEEAITPPSSVCYHGISLLDERERHYLYGFNNVSLRVDLRGHRERITLSRQSVHRDELVTSLLAELEPTYARLLDAHLTSRAQSAGGAPWTYKIGLANVFPLPTYWDSVPDFIRVFQGGQPELLTLKQFLELPTLAIAIAPEEFDRRETNGEEEELAAANWTEKEPIIPSTQIAWLPSEILSRFMRPRAVSGWRFAESTIPVIILSTDEDRLTPIAKAGLLDDYVYVGAVNESRRLVVPLGEVHRRYGALINTAHPMGDWISRVYVASALEPAMRDKLNRLLALITYSPGAVPNVAMINAFMRQWRGAGELNGELEPPDHQVTADEVAPFWNRDPLFGHRAFRLPGRSRDTRP